MLFHAPDALVRLGVGKNMVDSMRYWSQAFKLTHEYRNAEGRGPSQPRQHGARGGFLTRGMALTPTWRTPEASGYCTGGWSLERKAPSASSRAGT